MEADLTTSKVAPVSQFDACIFMAGG